MRLPLRLGVKLVSSVAASSRPSSGKEGVPELEAGAVYPVSFWKSIPLRLLLLEEPFSTVSEITFHAKLAVLFSHLHVRVSRSPFAFVGTSYHPSLFFLHSTGPLVPLFAADYGEYASI